MATRFENLTLSTMDLLDRDQLQRLEDKYVARTMRCVPDKFREMCHMHLSFLVDLRDDMLEMMLSPDEEHKKQKSIFGAVGMFKKKGTEKPQNDFFGVPLTAEGVSLTVPLINFLMQKNNICKEGLFRKSGNKNRINSLRELLITKSATDIDGQIFSPYDVACVLKEFLRELPEPLLTEQYNVVHRQVMALGDHASTPEEITRYTYKKVSALQLLMLLLPEPVRQLTMHLIRLLQQIAICPETKMTPETLGTIFAPIFFIDRKLEADKLLSEVSLTASGVSFMIEKADDLFHAPKELLFDLITYWNGISESSPHGESDSGSGQMVKSLSGRTLNTNVCYIDRELSRCDDVRSNTQAELASLFAHVHSLPDTPRNIQLKKHIFKPCSTPVSSSNKQSQSRSISASIRKRLPYLGKSKAKQHDNQSSCSSVMPDKNAKINQSETPCMTELLESPSAHQKSSRRKHKRSYNSENSDPAATSGCTPPKQECRGAEACISRSKESQRCHVRGHENENHIPVTPATAAARLQSPVKALSSTPVSRLGLSSPLSERNMLIHLENDITYLPNNMTKRIVSPRSIDKSPHKDRLGKASSQIRPCKAPWTPVMPRAALKLVHNNAWETSI